MIDCQKSPDWLAVLTFNNQGGALVFTWALILLIVAMLAMLVTALVAHHEGTKATDVPGIALAIFMVGAIFGIFGSGLLCYSNQGSLTRDENLHWNHIYEVVTQENIAPDRVVGVVRSQEGEYLGVTLTGAPSAAGAFKLPKIFKLVQASDGKMIYEQYPPLAELPASKPSGSQ